VALGQPALPPSRPNQNHHELIVLPSNMRDQPEEEFETIRYHIVGETPQLVTTYSRIRFDFAPRSPWRPRFRCLTR
jgi:hypothetical protein